MRGVERDGARAVAALLHERAAQRGRVGARHAHAAQRRVRPVHVAACDTQRTHHLLVYPTPFTPYVAKLPLEFVKRSCYKFKFKKKYVKLKIFDQSIQMINLIIYV